MEERIIDDEYGRGIRLKKTKDGYVDVTDELAEGELPESEEFEDGEEVAFEFPTFEQDEEDEDLIGLSPEEAAAKRKEKEEAAARKRAEYERLCKEGEELLVSESYKAAELKFEKALKLDEEAKEASVGYWRAKTANFTNPDVLAEEYAEEGIESLEYDLGYKAIDEIKREYRSVFERRMEELSEEEKPLAEAVESKQEKRRSYLKERFKKALLGFIISAVPFAVGIVLTLIFGLKNFTTPDSKYITPTIVCGGIAFVTFIVFLVFTNKFINVGRMCRANEKLESTEDGERLSKIRKYKEIYGCLLDHPVNVEHEEE